MNIIKVFLITSSLFFSTFTFAQQSHQHNHQQHEVGVSIGGAYGIEHREWAPVIHAHYFRSFTPHSRWAFGGGVEYIPGDEQHAEVAAGVRFEPIDKLQLSLMQGISIAEKTRFSVHAEVIYEVLHWGNFHMGPVAGYAWTKDHSHCSVGLHFALAFGNKHK